MYKTYYDKLQKKYGDKIQLQYTDCDSFVMSAQTDDIVNDLKETYKMYDFHNLDSNHELYDNRLEKIPGYLNIETPKSLYLDKFVAFRSKSYSYFAEEKNVNILKGVKKGVKNNEISFEDLKTAQKETNIEMKQRKMF